MQFIANGPDIPDILLHAHEEGNVVFFCGSGISHPAKLPDFKTLVAELYTRLCPNPSALQQCAIKKQQYDTAIALLEAAVLGNRETVRKEMAKILIPDLAKPKSRATHEALLQLSRTCKGKIRLITTNFDRVFEEVIRSDSLTVERYMAPLLPVPKNRWNGLVYLHGLLSETPTPDNLDSLVLDSGDFGLAYLTERWASRFVTTLFQNFNVCFIGYSINDPILRYMMDALAADKQLGEKPPEMFAFGSFSKGRYEQCKNEWESKHVIPILYEEHHHHAYLHRTLQGWSKVFRDGVLGKESVVAKYAIANPSGSTKQDDFVGRMIWAISDKSGIPAKRFADFSPVPPLTWLFDAFLVKQFVHSDLSRFGVPPLDKADTDLRFSLLHRPAPYTLAPQMSLFEGWRRDGGWDDVMRHLARWLTRHLDDPRLVIWLSNAGGRLHGRFLEVIEDRLEEIRNLEQQKGGASELDQIRTDAPYAIPTPEIRKLWQLFLTGRIKNSKQEISLNHWKDRFDRDGLTTALRLELRDLLSPKISLRQPFRYFLSDDLNEDGNLRLRDIVDWELELSADGVNSSLSEFSGKQWNQALPIILADFQQLLRDALDLVEELEGNDKSFSTLRGISSISDHWQNRNLDDWTVLVILLRDSWLATMQKNSVEAIRIAEDWFVTPHLIFKRLALFAASQDGCIPARCWVKWLLADDAELLWSPFAMREVMRLLVAQSRTLVAADQSLLESAILSLYQNKATSDSNDNEQDRRSRDREVWLRLIKMEGGGTVLGENAKAQLRELSSKNLGWCISSNEREEFSIWSSGTGDPEFVEEQTAMLNAQMPHKRAEWVKWLQNSFEDVETHRRNDIWRHGCRKHPLQTGFALYDLSMQNIWPVQRWLEALSFWSEEPQVRRSWKLAAPCVNRMPDSEFKDAVRGVAWWLESASKSCVVHEEILLNLCKRILKYEGESKSDDDDLINAAIKHPVGHVAQVFLNLWLNRNPSDRDKLPESLKPFFTMLCDKQRVDFRHARLLLASRLIQLFRVDQEWTEAYLLPLLNWNTDALEAASAWQGFLWSPRLHLPLLAACKEQLLETARHYTQLGKHGRQFTSFITYMALDSVEGYSTQDFKLAFSNFPAHGLQEAAYTLCQALESAGDQREENWTNRIEPFLRDVWPRTNNIEKKTISSLFSRLCIAAGGKFPEAWTAIKPWASPITYSAVVVALLNSSGLCSRFPDTSLELLSEVIDDQTLVGNKLGIALKAIALASPRLKNDRRFVRLYEYAQT